MNWQEKLTEPEYEPEFLDHISWFEKNLKIRTKQATVEPLIFNKIQRILEYHKWKKHRDVSPAILLILKARQEGCSTWAEATMFKDSREMSNRQSFVLAHKEDATRKLFGMSKRFVDKFPEPIELDKSSARTLKFMDNESELQVETAGSGGGAGRAATAQAIHLSELDQYQDPEEVLTAIMPTLPDKGKITLIAESTANGPMMTMNALWDRASAGKNEFEPFFFPWWIHDEYRLDLSFETMKKYAPADWLARRGRWLAGCERRTQDALARLRQSGLRRLPEGDSGRGKKAATSLHGDAKEAAGAGGSPAEAQAERSTTGKDDAGEGSSSRGHLPSVLGPEGTGQTPPGNGRQDHHGRNIGGPTDGIEGRELREVRPGDKIRNELRGKFGLESIDPGDYGGPEGLIEKRTFSIETIFVDSLTDYEIGLILEFDLDLEQINWLRYCLENKANGSETSRKREYPSRPEEAFEAFGSDVLDPRVLSIWFKEAKDDAFVEKGSMQTRETAPGLISVSFNKEDRNGKIEIYEQPDPHLRYVLSIDPSQGIEGSDWTVGFVGEVQSGKQVAEFRATIDPDLAVNQLEALGIYYNKAKVIVETNGGYGWPYVRHLLDRNTLPMYERMAFDRATRMLTKRPGWDSNTKTRPLIWTEMKEAVRKEHAKVRSIETISELRSLWENDQGKIEARPGKHDDGAMAFGMFLIFRNQILGIHSLKQDEEEKKNSFVAALDRKLKKPPTSLKHVISHMPIKKKHVHGILTRYDGRRSAL